MAFYVTLFAVYLALVGLWLWSVAKWTGLRFPVPDIVITAAVCSAPAVFGALAQRPVQGWLLGLIILALIAVRVRDAELWPDLALMAAGTVLVWFAGFGVALLF